MEGWPGSHLLPDSATGSHGLWRASRLYNRGSMWFGTCPGRLVGPHSPVASPNSDPFWSRVGWMAWPGYSTQNSPVPLVDFYSTCPFHPEAQGLRDTMGSRGSTPLGPPWPLPHDFRWATTLSGEINLSARRPGVESRVCHPKCCQSLGNSYLPKSVFSKFVGTWSSFLSGSQAPLRRLILVLRAV